MRAVSLIFALAMLANPVAAEDTPTPDDDPGIFGEAARGLLEDFARRMAPALEEMQDELAPALEDFAARLGELNAYHPPEVLPNGDIIIRRKDPVDPTAPEPAAPGDAIDL